MIKISPKTTDTCINMIQIWAFFILKNLRCIGNQLLNNQLVQMYCENTRHSLEIYIVYSHVIVMLCWYVMKLTEEACSLAKSNIWNVVQLKHIICMYMYIPILLQLGTACQTSVDVTYVLTAIYSYLNIRTLDIILKTYILHVTQIYTPMQICQMVTTVTTGADKSVTYMYILLDICGRLI